MFLHVINYRSFREIMLKIDDKSIVVGGKSGSGKTNLISSIVYMRDMVMSSGCHKANPYLNPFYDERSSMFVAGFDINEIPHMYQFQIKDDNIHLERSVFYPKKRPAQLFVRHGAECKFGTYVKNKGMFRTLSKNIGSNQLYQTIFGKTGNSSNFGGIGYWFRNTLQVVSENDITAKKINNNAKDTVLVEEYRNKIVDMLNPVLGISNIDSKVRKLIHIYQIKIELHYGDRHSLLYQDVIFDDKVVFDEDYSPINRIESKESASTIWLFNLACWLVTLDEKHIIVIDDITRYVDADIANKVVNMITDLGHQVVCTTNHPLEKFTNCCRYIITKDGHESRLQRYKGTIDM